jgi:hypothetical protein
LHPLDDICSILNGRRDCRYNSRFGVFNSRLGANKFPYGRQRELAGKRPIYFAVFCAKTALCCTDRQPGEVSPRAHRSWEANVLRPPKPDVSRLWNAEHRELVLPGVRLAMGEPE